MTVTKQLIGVIAVIIIVAVVGGLGYRIFFAERSESDPEVLLQSMGINNSEVPSIEVPDGWKTHWNYESGYGFAYPKDWIISPQMQPYGHVSQDMIELQKGAARILLDPNGHVGSESIRVDERTTVIAGGAKWTHFYNYEFQYHRFIDLSHERTPRPELVGGSDNGFRLHVYLEDVKNQEERAEAIETARGVLTTITLK